MPMPARDLWSRIQKQLQGCAEDEQLRILRQHLGDLHDEWKGPYKDLRDRLRRQADRLESHAAVRSRGGQHDPFHVKRQGDASVAVAGVPNSGKSALVGALTGAATVIADYPFATQHPAPGMLPCAGGALQLIDTPPVVAGLSGGQGAGRALLHLLSQADALIVTVDLTADPLEPVQTVLTELAEACLLPISGPLATVLRPRGKGGVTFLGPSLSREAEAAARVLLQRAHVEHAEIHVRTTYDEAVLQSQVDGDVPLPVVLVGTRAQAAEPVALGVLRQRWPQLRCLAVDTDQPDSLTMLPPVLLDALGFMQIQIVQRPAAEAPGDVCLVHVGSAVSQAAERASVPAARLKGARVWGPSVPRPGQAVGLDHIVEAGDRVYLQA